VLAPAGPAGREALPRRDLVCLPRQAERAARRFPDARLHWFERCGHFPQWDAPEEATRLILETTRSR
jgi:pimeloyl-ACP methyl ester carboxylesterase